ACLEGFGTVPGLLDLVEALGFDPDDSPGSAVAACELALEALVADRRLSRSEGGRYGRAKRQAPAGGPGGAGPQGPLQL
ncbi:MAG: hypothetical protein ACODAE_08415, partial [Gemmatimonadota bacterium]